METQKQKLNGKDITDKVMTLKQDTIDRKIIPIPAKILERSKQTALSFLKQFPNAQVYPHDPVSLIVAGGWRTTPGFTAKEIKEYKQPALWGLKMSSVPLVVLDFDIKSLFHKEGITEAKFTDLKKKFGLENYPYFTLSKSGRGGHFWCSDSNAPRDKDGNKIESGMQYIKGIDYKSKTMIFLNEYPFNKGLNGLKPIPQAFFDMNPANNRTQKTTPPSNPISAHSTHADYVKKYPFGPSLNHRNIPYRAGWAGARGNFKAKEFDLTDMAVKNPGNPELRKHIADYENKFNECYKLYYKPVKKAVVPQSIATPFPTGEENISAILHQKTHITDIHWLIPDWLEATGLGLIGGPGGSGKSTFAIKIAVLNSMKKQFWKNGPIGDGRKSLYICFERAKNRAVNKEIACGGDGNQIDILSHIKNENGERVEIDLENPHHLNAIFKIIKENNYAMVIFDPVADLVLSNQNDNAFVRKQLTKLFRMIEEANIKTLLLGITHLRKEKLGIDDMGSFRGASEQGNMANSNLKVFKLKDDAGFVVCKLKVNEAKTHRGGIKYKITDCLIPDKYLQVGSLEKTKGGIAELNFTDKPVSVIKKDCESEIDHGDKETNFEKIGKIIGRLKAENKELNTKTIKDLARVEGVSNYYFQKKLDWTEYGYEEKSGGQGKDYKIVLKELKKNPYPSL